MTDQPTALDPVADPRRLLAARDPDTIADALDLYARLAALDLWVNERQRDVARWVATRADERRSVDGAAPTWRVDGGTVLQTDPKPKPRVSDPEAFARWYLALLDVDPDPTGRDVYFVDGQIHRVLVASCEPAALLDFLDGLAAADGYADEVRATAATLSTAISTDDCWTVDETLLTDAIRDGLVTVVGGDDDPVAIDGDGSVVPGVTVAAAAPPTVQMRPSPQTKTSVRQQLDDLIGPATVQRGTEQ
jgi:hypothetical protein